MKTFQKLLDETKRVQCTDKDVVDSIESSEEQNIEFFTLGNYVPASELDREAEKQGFILATPYALALYAKDHPELADEKSIATQWKDKNGKWCYIAFNRWYGDERDVSVDRRESDWFGHWWFAGVRKSALKNSETQTSALSTLVLCPSCGAKLEIKKA